MMHPIFVFGTLKEGFPNSAINKGRRLPGEFRTLERLPFYLVGERYSPWLINAPGEGEQVKGQVFEVDDATLVAMDSLERTHAVDGYRRMLIQVSSLNQSNMVLEVNAYLKTIEHLDKNQIKLGPLSDYTLEHAALYKKRP